MQSQDARFFSDIAAKQLCYKTTFNDLFLSFISWSRHTFVNGTSIGGLNYAKQEIDEVIADINSNAPKEQKALEYVDVMMCIIDSASREGITVDELMTAFEYKFAINMHREWKENGDGSYSHIKKV